MEGSGHSPTLPTSLLDLLCNSLVLKQLAPYIPIASRLALAVTNKTLRQILRDAPEAYRYVDLSACKSAQVADMSVDRGGISWRSQRMDEALTEDDVYCGPLRGIFSRLTKLNAMTNIHTLILDGLTVPADLVQEIISDSNVRILSLREARQLNQRKLMQVLEHACRPTRPTGTPRLKGLYVFGRKSQQTKSSKSGSIPRSSSHSALPQSLGVTVTDGAQIGASWNQKSSNALGSSFNQCEDKWYLPTGRVIKQSEYLAGWADTMKACDGLIAFDAVLCRGPRHDITTFSPEALQDPGPNERFLRPAIASIALGPKGCASCRSAAEGPARCGCSPIEYLPLLDPPPTHSSSVTDAQKPNVTLGSFNPPLYVRCPECLAGRWCERCFKWWDETCYPAALIGSRSSEVRNAAAALDQRRWADQSKPNDVRVFLGLCIDSCLVSEEMSGSGSGGMWG